jgi:hypothetical protein
LTHYAKKHPEAGLDVFVIPQVPGLLPRSRSNTGVLEGVVRRYGAPLVLLSPETAGVVLVAYVSHGRFEMPKDAPPLNLNALQTQLTISRPFPVTPPELPEPRPLLVTPADVAAAQGPRSLQPVSMLH